MDPRDRRADAFCAHTVAKGGHMDSYKRSLHRTVLEAPEPFGYNDKLSKDCSQYGRQTEGEEEASPLRTSFSCMADKGPCDLALRKYGSHTRAVSCTPDHKCASRVRLPHLRPFSFLSL